MAVDPRFLFDVFSAVLLFLVALLGSWAPLALHSKEDSASPALSGRKMAYHLLNCMSGGVMLAAGFCHLLADALIDLAFIETPYKRFPMANFLAAIGFLVTLASDQVVHMISEPASVPAKLHDRFPGACDMELARQNGSKAEGSESSDEEDKNRPVRNKARREKIPLLEPLRVTTPTHEAHVALQDLAPQTDHSLPGKSHSVPQSIRPSDSTILQVHAQGQPHSHNWGSSERLNKDSETADFSRESLQGEHETAGLIKRRRSGQQGCSEEGEEHGHYDILISANQPSLHFATAVLLAVALCVHSVLEGMALGAQRSMESTRDILIAIAAHKGLAAYALGASVVQTGAPLKRFWAVTITFSLATPLAIFVGYALSGVGSKKGGSALSALASGTFLYVAMMEVIPRELSAAHAAKAGTQPAWLRPAKLASLLLGFFLMSMLALWA
mmetsp:Transcript_4530/g.7693  ORF Transcript_4530/g.7693 Transcript_4530/m.7693 type:complete len:443 (-) Transcript_4530:493-1821(-)|eukprot:CAMPEP_0119109394 /NCGR_PEP_ID=MMETSP1180-20130426/17883_1 /TAXON_ID=3052 ORGANISM="Chlamydomonas cf sp, Strain CCMP681" /NCGR_SAMPLE_ID=MMETSP1180 /ASSEMBLY_ACC=CAM_ASM_000741 /LENGTH=442 /DNA_ID=CAMNT_0007095147 /DNA_START=184 /DNA_END=1512 /DNA_ORIENTATION=-